MKITIDQVQRFGGYALILLNLLAPKTKTKLDDKAAEGLAFFLDQEALLSLLLELLNGEADAAPSHLNADCQTAAENIAANADSIRRALVAAEAVYG